MIWIVIVLSMFLCAIAMTCVFYQDFASNPIRLNIESDHTPLTNLIFPAVTVCPPTMYNYPEVKRIFQGLTLPPNVTLDEAIESLDQVYSVVSKVREISKRKLQILHSTIYLNNYTTYDFLKLVRWKCEDFIFRCRFQSKIVNCNETFGSSKTHVGYCCSFNIDELGKHYHGYSASKFGPEGGLSVIFKNTKPDQERVDKFITSEIELYVHTHDEYPHKTLTTYAVKVNREVFAVVKPTETVCSAEFKSLSIENRQCLLPHEHSLRYFKTYNTDNCEFECRSMPSFDTCDCIPYIYYISSPEKCCDFIKLQCLYKVFDTNQKSVADSKIQTNSSCYCPNSCQKIEYDVKITQTILQTSVESYDPFYYGIKENYTVLHVFMKSQVYRRYRRDTLSDVVILIGNLGSSFSLFVGMSMISLLEIGYFFTMVLWQNYVKLN